MRSVLILSVLIYTAAPQAFAAGRNYERNTDLQQEVRGISSITELLPELDSLDCTPKCEGQALCGQYTNVDSCLNNDDGVRGCFWSCE